MTLPPTAIWTEISSDAKALRGRSSKTGAIELPLDRILGIGQHVRYADYTNPITPDTETWVSILTAEEFGLIHESSWSRELTESLADALGDDRLHLLLWGEWLGWNSDRGNDTRFLHPSWVFGLPVYEWPNATDAVGGLGATAAWLVDHSPRSQREQWEDWLRAPTPATTLGSVRCSGHWEFPFQVWWLPYALTFAAAMGGGVYWERLTGSASGWAALAACAFGLGVLWQPQWLAQTTLHDHGLTLRTRGFRRQRCTYAEITSLEKSDAGIAIRTPAETLTIPAGHGLHRTQIEDLSGRSRALLFAEATASES